MAIKEIDYNVPVEAEEIRDYVGDGWMPIYLHDKFQDGRYEIVNKLGFGGFATVWAAKDHQLGIHVCIKLIKASNSLHNRELRILKHINKQDDTHPGRKHLVKMLDNFTVEHDGKPSLFIVLELLGPMLREVDRGGRYDSKFTPRISKEILLGLECLHSYGIVHGDLHEANIVMDIPAGYTLPLNRVTKGTVTRKDGGTLEHGIPSQVFGSLLNDLGGKTYELFRERGHIKLVDFSSSFFEWEAMTQVVTRKDVMSPELIFRKELGTPHDIWAFACVLYYMATGRRLFETGWGQGGRDTLRMMNVIAGPSSAQWFLDAMFEAIESKLWPDIATCRFKGTDYTRNLEELLKSSRIDDQAFLQLVRKSLVVDPEERATASELLKQESVQ